MLHDIPVPAAAQPDPPAPAPHPLALALIQAMSGCCHPRAGRLATRLLECDRPEQLAPFRNDVLDLLALSFGPQEARRRLSGIERAGR